MENTTQVPTEVSDVLIIGSGVAGMTAALGLAPLTVTLVTKGQLGSASSSELAQGGVAVALSDDDSPEMHTADTLAVGGELSDREVVELVTRSGPQQISRLLSLGASFDLDQEGQLSLGREAAHHKRRIVHAHGDSTGAELVRTLRAAILQSPTVRVVEQFYAADLVTDDEKVRGVLGHSASGFWRLIQAGAVVLATGGSGALFAHTTNPPESIGDGLAMAARAGAWLEDLEFMQFHPTALNCSSNPMPLLTEALRGEGASLIDGEGVRFMLDEHPLAELAPRDTVSRAIWKRLRSGNQVFLDCRDAVGEKFPEKFPTVFGFCKKFGFDPRIEPIPVAPAAHYHIGGVSTDRWGRTSLAGLWACGEVAGTGLHGANRLASNSLLEALVFGTRVAKCVKRNWSAGSRPCESAQYKMPLQRVGASPNPRLRKKIQHIMWEKVGLVRNGQGLTEAIAELQRLDSRVNPDDLEARNLLTVGRLIATAALKRRESRGVHYRSDYPKTDRAWNHHIHLRDPLFERKRLAVEAR